MASLCLLGEDGLPVGRWDLGDGPLAIGRGEAADIIVDDDALSRRHFEISREGGNYLLRDLNSQNGTFVDGQRARATPLHHSDCILAGRTLFVFTEPPSAGPGQLAG